MSTPIMYATNSNGTPKNKLNCLSVDLNSLYLKPIKNVLIFSKLPIEGLVYKSPHNGLGFVASM